MQRTAYRLALFALVSTLACREHVTSSKETVVHQPTEIPKGAASISENVEYTIGFEDAQHHYISVRAVYPAPANSEVQLQMAVWTPGSYLVREYARHIESLQFVDLDGSPLGAKKNRKNRWTITTGQSPGFIAEYKVYCRELSVRTNFVDVDAAVLNGAPTFLALVEKPTRAHTVKLNLPSDWRAATGLDPASAEANHFIAKSYDELIDSPIVAGKDLVINEFEVEAVPHRLVHLGDSSQWNLEKTLQDVQQLAQTEAQFWGVIPYERYDFLNVILGGGGGLEHLDSTLMLATPFATRTSKGYKRWLGLVAHEFFHTWNVKRLRPAQLGPFDYENENYTRSLWVAEGITSYYDDLLLRRAGLLDEQEYITRLGEQIQSLQDTPGRLVQPLARASYDAWIKHYRRDANSANTSISYYTKGAVVAFLLDCEIRISSGGTKSLDDLMRLLYSRYAGDTGYTPEQFRSSANEVAGADLSTFFATAIDSTQELNYQPALTYYGLKFSTEQSEDDESSEQNEEDDPAGWMGLVMNGDFVRSVRRDTPAFAAGFNVDDEIIAMNGYRNQKGLPSLLATFKPGQEVTVTISRRAKLRSLKTTLGKEPKKAWSLSVDTQRDGAQGLRYRQWLAEKG